MRNEIELRCLVMAENIDVIEVTETPTDTANKDLLYEYNIEDFKFFNKDRLNRRGGGVALYVASWLNPVETSTSDTYVGHVCVKVIISQFTFNISVTYRLSGQTHEHDTEMYRVLRQTLRNGESFILGDFDFPYINWQTLSGVESKSHRMLEFLEDNFLSQLVSEPTRENSIHDLVIVSQDHLINNVEVGEHLGSCDHKLVCSDISTIINIFENKMPVSNFRRDNSEDLRRAVLHLQLPDRAQVDETWPYFKNKLLTQQRNFVPYCKR